MGEAAIDFAAIADFYGQLSFGMRIVKVRNSFRHAEKAMDIVSRGKHRARYLPGARATFGNHLNELRLAFVNRPQVAVKQFFVIMHRFAVTAQHQSRRETADTSKTYQIFRER